MRPLAHAVLDADPRWVEAFWFELPGRVRSKSNARRFSRGRAGAKERAAYQANRSFAELVRATAELVVPRGWELGPTGTGTLPRRPDVVSVVLARSTLDATNIPKTLHDALEGIVFHNDASIRAPLALTVRGAGGGGVVGFARLEPGSSSGQHLDAVTGLSQLLLPVAAGLVDGLAA